jgi:hypothetical protein
MRFACLFIVLFAVLFAHAQEVDTASVSATNNTQVVEDNNIARIRYQYERAIKVGDRQKSLGTGLVIGGGVGITAGIAITVYAIKLINDNDHKKQKGDCGSADGGPMFVMFMGTGTMVVGGAAIVTGIIFRHMGIGRLEKAKTYEDQLRGYGLEHLLVSARLIPVINPLSHEFGGNLLLDF